MFHIKDSFLNIISHNKSLAAFWMNFLISRRRCCSCETEVSPHTHTHWANLYKWKQSSYIRQEAPEGPSTTTLSDGSMWTNERHRKSFISLSKPILRLSNTFNELFALPEQKLLSDSLRVINHKPVLMHNTITNE